MSLHRVCPSFFSNESISNKVLLRYNASMKILIAILFFAIGWGTKTYFDESQCNSTTHEVVQQKQNRDDDLAKILKKGQLDVIILNAPTVYYIGADIERGFEFELISDYARYLGVKLNLHMVYTTAEALELTKKGVGDITVAAITKTPERSKEFVFGPSYMSIQEQLICSDKLYKEHRMPKAIEDLVDLKIVVGKNTTYEATLNEVKKEVDGFDFNATTEFSSEQLLEMVQNKSIDCTVVDSNIFMINHRYYPEISRVMTFGKYERLAWVLRKKSQRVQQSLYEWLNEFERSGKMDEVRDFYYSYLSLFDYYDTKIFYKRLKTRFPKYKKYFQEAGKKYGIDWMLLAAQSYQESHWNPHAKSHTGVRGMMMLTLKTAKSLGIKNRLNPKQSIFGGAKYLASIEKRFPKEIQGKNRWAFTFAAYNVGMGHIHDAQTLARKLNKNPYLWSDIKETLPLLSQRKYYKQTKYGYARGSEPVFYVNSILYYYNIIAKFSH